MSFLNKLANWLDQWIWIYLIIIFLPIPIWLAVQFFDKSAGDSAKKDSKKSKLLNRKK